MMNFRFKQYTILEHYGKEYPKKKKKAFPSDAESMNTNLKQQY